MKFKIDHKDKVAIITSTIEKLDAIQAPELKGEIVLLNKEGHKNIILDLSGLFLI